MNDGSGHTRISLRQADGDFFPIFRHGDPDTRNLSLVPASEGQGEADIQFFHHPMDGSRPVKIGTVRFTDLPVDDDGVELQLDAVIGATGLLSITVRHRDSGRTERLEVELPGDASANGGRALRSRGWRDGRFRWLFGILFVLAGLALVYVLTMMMTDWGREERLDAPMSRTGPATVEVPA